MSAPIRRRSALRRWAAYVALAGAAAALTASIAAALQVRRVVVEGAAGAVLDQVQEVLAAAVGSPTLGVRAEELRAAVLQQVAWVEDAAVSVSLDGVVHCTVTLRQPAAVLADGTRPLLIDGTGRILGEPLPGVPLPTLQLVAYGAYPEERAALLAALPAIEAAWGGPVRSVERLGPRDVAISFVGTSLQVVADPSRPADLAAGRAVLAAWERHFPAAVGRLDVRVPGRVAVQAALGEGGA